MSDRSVTDLSGQVLGNYRVVAPLGSGGMGRVFRAQHLHLEREAAVKVLHAHLVDDDAFRTRFLFEARSASLLEHPHIVRMFDYGEHEIWLYIVMELLTDGSLRSWLRHRGGPAARSRSGGLELVLQSAAGLAYAHARGMVHRDIKPDNLLLRVETDPEGIERAIVKVGDFGLARMVGASHLTASGVALGTPAYMSPEQCQGRELDHRSDIYSLGIVLYEVATGRLPFEAKSLSDAVYHHVYVGPPPPRSLRADLSPELEAVILRCLSKRPEDRYASMAELAADLRAVLPDEEPLPAAPVPSVAPHPTPETGVLADDAPTPEPSAVPPAPTPPPSAIPGTGAGARVPRVYIFNAEGEVREVAVLTGNGLTIGRLADNDIVLPEPGISRHHLQVDWNGTAARVTDLGSSNGSLLGGLPLPQQVPHAWDHGQDVRVGPLRLRLELPAPQPLPVVSNALPAEREPAAASVPAAAALPVGVAADTASVQAPPSVAAPGSGAVPEAAYLSEVSAQPSAAAMDAASARSGRRLTTVLVLGLAIVLLAALGAWLFAGGSGDDDDETAAAGATATSGASGSGSTAGTGGSGSTAAAASAQAGATGTPGVEGTSGSGAQATAEPTATIPALPTRDVSGLAAIARDGAPVTVEMTTPGQNVELAFQGRAGERVRVEVSDIQIGPEQAYTAEVTLLDPSGTWLASTALWPAEGGALIDTTDLPIDGTYTLKVNPLETFTGSVAVALFDVPPDTEAQITPGGESATAAISSAGQSAIVWFHGTAGERVMLELTDIEIGPLEAYTAEVIVAGPDGTSLTTAYLWPATGNHLIDTLSLPATGDYQVIVNPAETYTGSVKVDVLVVPPDALGQITPGGESVTAATSQPGQAARLTFEGRADQRVSLEMTEIDVGPPEAYTAEVRILAPDGTIVVSTSIWPADGREFIDATTLPVDGAYTILFDPLEMHTGTITFTLYDVP